MSEGNQSLQRQADRSKPGSGRSVLSYLAVLFAAAFILLLLAYFMQQRTNQAALDDLEQSSHTAARSVEQLSEENHFLKEQIAQLENDVEYWHDQLILTTDTLESLDAAHQQTERFYSLIKTLYQAEYLVSQQQYADAGSLINEWDDSLLNETILEYAEADPSDPVAIAARFQELVSKLQRRGYLQDLELEDLEAGE